VISPAYSLTMARYNRWQNRCVIDAAETLPREALAMPRGAFWGSILGTLSHLLWGDLVWMSRFDGGPRPPVGMADSADQFADWADWRRERQATDGRIVDWAGRLTDEELSGELFWHSGALGRAVSKPKALCVAHFFNHQTHHRGQVHAMLTAAGARTADTDLFVMPDEADWM
jgi:uncharacterized damage-inducible protein DinB